MMVKLNINLLSIEGLTNNARVIVRDISYKNFYKHKEMSIVMVEFLKWLSF